MREEDVHDLLFWSVLFLWIAFHFYLRHKWNLSQKATLTGQMVLAAVLATSGFYAEDYLMFLLWTGTCLYSGYEYNKLARQTKAPQGNEE